MPMKKRKEDYVEVEVMGKKQTEPTVITRVPAASKKEDDQGKDIDTKISELRKLTEKIKLEKNDEDHEEEGNPEKKTVPKETEFVGEVMKTSVDKLYDLVKIKNIIKVRTASKILGVSYDIVEEWARVLEDNKMIKLHYPSFGEPVMILRKFRSKFKKGKKTVKGVAAPPKKKKSKRTAFALNLIILSAFVVVIAVYMMGGFGGLPMPADNPTIYVYGISGIVAVAAFIFIARAFVRFRKNSKEKAVPRPPKPPIKAGKKQNKDGKKEVTKGKK